MKTSTFNRFKKLIAKNGRLIEVVTEGEVSQFGPSTANDSEPETVNAVQVKFDAREIDGNQIRSTDIKLLWMGDGPVPDTNKYIRDQDRRLQIVNYATVHVGKVLALYEVQARG